MILKRGIRLPFDRMVPAYDLEFHPSVMSFRAPGGPRRPTESETTIFEVHNTYEVHYFDPANTELEFMFKCSQNDYERLKKIYEGGRHG